MSKNIIEVKSEKIALDLKNLCEMIETISDSNNSARLNSYCDELGKELIKMPIMALEDPAYLAISLIQNLKFTDSYPWKSYLDGKKYAWEDIKSSILANKKGKTLVEFFLKIDEEILQTAIIICFLYNNKKQVVLKTIETIQEEV